MMKLLSETTVHFCQKTKFQCYILGHAGSTFEMRGMLGTITLLLCSQHLFSSGQLHLQTKIGLHPV